MSHVVLGRARLLLVGAVLAFTSCASLALQRATDNVADLINLGDSSTLTANSSVPFLLDDELLVRTDDVDEFWRLATSAGYRLEIVDVSVERLAGTGAYADRMDVRTFLNTMVPRRARLVRVATPDGTVLFIMGRVRGAVPELFGFKGPL